MKRPKYTKTPKTQIRHKKRTCVFNLKAKSFLQLKYCHNAVVNRKFIALWWVCFCCYIFSQSRCDRLIFTVRHCLYLLRRYVAPVVHRGKHKCLPYGALIGLAFEFLFVSLINFNCLLFKKRNQKDKSSHHIYIKNLIYKIRNTALYGQLFLLSYRAVIFDFLILTLF